MKWITTEDLDRWANTTGSRTAISELISELIRASATDVTSFRFPTGDSAQIPGYDGRLEALGAPPYVPDGLSVWEFGVGSDYETKANEDYDTRTKHPESVDTNKTTFVFVTPRVWRTPPQKKKGKRAAKKSAKKTTAKKLSLAAWEKLKRAEKIWKNVRVIDGVMLAAWLEQHEAVAARFARLELKTAPAAGVRSTIEYWDEYAARFRPPVTEAVLLSGREEQAKELASRLAGSGADILRYRADSPDEVVAFAISAIRNAAPDLRKFIEARTLVIDDEQAARQLSQRKGMIFIPRGSALSVAGLLGMNNRTIVAIGRDKPGRDDALLLNRPTSHQLAKAIESMGFDEDTALRKARECGQSVTILARRIPNADAPLPPWADGNRTLLPALLAGAWDASVDADQKALQALAASASYAEYETALLPMLKLQDPPIDREGSVWQMRAPTDAFAHLGHLFGRDDWIRFRAVLTQVFSEYDPSLDEPVSDRPVFTERKKLSHSEWLRDGLATTLLQIAVPQASGELHLPDSTPAQFVEDLVQSLPGLNKDYRLIASLRNELPIFMEAAPRPLLAALERLLEGDPESVRPIFRESGLFGPSSPHTGLLWALETIAWDPDYLTQSALILAKLARIDPGGNLGNRPINSLREIFLPWHPGTNATLRQRLAALDHIAGREPAIGWELLLKLLPTGHDAASETAKPRYREAGASEREVLTWGLVFETNREIVRRALKLIADDPQRWNAIIKAMSDFEPALREDIYDRLQSYIARATAEQRLVVWASLRDEANRHRAFQDAEWSLKDPELARLDAMLEALQPNDPITRLSWLFDDHVPDMPGAFDDRGKVVEDARHAAVREISSYGGYRALLELADRVQYPHFVAAAIVNTSGALGELDKFIEDALAGDERRQQFAMLLSGYAHMKFRHAWVEHILNEAKKNRWTPNELTLLVLDWQEAPETWDAVATLGTEVEKAYWRRKRAWLIDCSFPNLDVVAKKYLDAGRAGDALDVLHECVDRLPIELVFQLLDAAIEELGSGTKPTGMFLHHVTEIFDAITKRPDVPTIEIAKREYAYLPLFSRREKTLTLHKLMAEDPEFFVSVLCDVFKPRSGEPNEPTPEARARARAGHQLLSTFHQLPGTEGGKIVTKPIQQWATKVRELAAEKDRLEVADIYIGHIFAHAPKDPDDGAWPHRAIRDAIEALASDDIGRGIMTERHNMRGVYGKAMFEGGAQERALAAEATNWAKAANGWPRTASILRAIARSWAEDAKREDLRARQDKMRFK